MKAAIIGFSIASLLLFTARELGWEVTLTLGMLAAAAATAILITEST